MKNNDDIYIITLKILKEYLSEGLTYSELLVGLKKYDVDIEKNDNARIMVKEILNKYCDQRKEEKEARLKYLYL